jgi:predicted acetyltransferase
MALMIDIRTTRPEEYRIAAATANAALLTAPPDDDTWEKAQASWADSDSLSAWDGGRCVGHVCGYRLDTVVPGGARLPTCGVARMGILPTHRRRGLASGLVRQLLRDAAGRGKVLASLRASEALIYERFGFGIAGDSVEATIDPAAGRPFRGAAGGSMRLLAPDEILDVVVPLYDRAATRPGAISRPSWMWRRYFEPALTAGGDPEFVAVHADASGVDDGFVHYAVKWKPSGPVPAGGEGEVFDAFGTSVAVELALWNYLCDLDLVREWLAQERPVDDPVRLAARDSRAYAVKRVIDEQWLRLLDVDAALTARTYGNGVACEAVTIAVSDDLFPANSAVWRVDSTGASRAEIDPAQADLATGVAALAATYLGGVRWSALAAIGRVDVGDASALARADALFLHSSGPYCGSFF